MGKSKAGRPTEYKLQFYQTMVDMHKDIKFLKAEAHAGELRDYVYGVTHKLLASIYGNEGYWMEWNEEVAIIFSSENFKVLTYEHIEHIVQILIKVGFFHKGMYDKYGILTSKAIQIRWQWVINNAKRLAKIENKYRLSDEENDISTGSNSNSTGSNSSEVIHIEAPQVVMANRAPSISTGSNSISTGSNAASAELMQSERAEMQQSKVYLLTNTKEVSKVSSGPEVFSNGHSEPEKAPPSGAAPPQKNEPQEQGMITHGSCFEKLFSGSYTEELFSLAQLYGMILGPAQPDIALMKRWCQSYVRFMVKGKKPVFSFDSWKNHFVNWFKSNMKQHRYSNPDELNTYTMAESAVDSDFALVSSSASIEEKESKYGRLNII